MFDLDIDWPAKLNSWNAEHGLDSDIIGKVAALAKQLVLEKYSRLSPDERAIVRIAHRAHCFAKQIAACDQSYNEREKAIASARVEHLEVPFGKAFELVREVLIVQLTAELEILSVEAQCFLAKS